jgi:hypothetical protein
MMGPVFGFGCALVMLLIYEATKIPMYAAGASWMAMINLFNLLPINPLDGGRVMKSIAFSIHSRAGFVFLVFGIFAGIALAIWAHIWIFILLVIVSSLELAVEYLFSKGKRKDLNAATLQLAVTTQKVAEQKKYYADHMMESPTDIKEMESTLAELKAKLEKEPLMKPVMTVREILTATLEYFTLAILLFVFMAMTSQVPGASLASLMLQ